MGKPMMFTQPREVMYILKSLKGCQRGITELIMMAREEEGERQQRGIFYLTQLMLLSLNQDQGRTNGRGQESHGYQILTMISSPLMTSLVMQLRLKAGGVT